MKKKTNKLDKFRKKLVGLIVSWQDSDPMSPDSDVTCRLVSHTNPVRRIDAEKLTKGRSELIFHKMTFKWNISITGIFQYPNKQEQRETREMTAIKDIPYAQKFYWKGNKYKQIIRPKKPQGKFTVICSLDNYPSAEWVSMPGGRTIKPVKRVHNAKV